MAGSQQQRKVACSAEEWEVRCELAGLYRIAGKIGWSEVIFNHITCQVPGGEGHFLINPFGLRYDEVTAESLVKVDLKGNVIDGGSSQYHFNLAGYVIHSAIHEARDDLKCIIHHHSNACQAVSSLSVGFLATSQEACIVHPKVSPKYHRFQGVATDPAEKAELVANLGSASVLFLQNHGVLVGGTSISEAFASARQIQRACEMQLEALRAAGGDVSKIVVVPQDMIDSTAERRKLLTDLAMKRGTGVAPERLMFLAKLRELDAGYRAGAPARL